MALLDEYQLTAWVHAAVDGGQPHPALWDTIGAALLLEDLVRRQWRQDPTLPDLISVAAPAGWRPSPPSLFDPADEPPPQGHRP